MRKVGQFNVGTRVLSVAAAAALLGLAGTAWAWDTATDISGPGASIGLLHLAVDGKGRTAAVWSEYDGLSNQRAVAALRQPGQSFGGPAQISFGGASAYGNAIAVSKKGHIAVVWRRSDGSTYSTAQIAVAEPGAASFGTPVNVSPVDGWADSVLVGMDKKGNTTVLWEDFATGYDPTAATRTVGGSFGTPQTISTSGSNGLQLIEDAKGNAVAFWHDHDGMNYVIYASVRPADGPFGTPQLINDAMTPGTFPTGACDRKGNAFVGWWGYGATLAAKNSTFGIPVSTPMGQGTEFAFDKKGNLSAFSAGIGFGYTARYALRPAGGEFGAATEISTPGDPTRNSSAVRSIASPLFTACSFCV